MDSQNFKVLELKLKRQKICYQYENGKVSIGKLKPDYFTIIGLVILPIIGSLGLAVFILLESASVLDSSAGIKITIAIVTLMLTALLSLLNFRLKKKSNSILKTLENNRIILQSEKGRFELYNDTVSQISFSVDKIEENLFHGRIILVDFSGRTHELLGINDENESYILDDLHWFVNFFKTYLKLE